MTPAGISPALTAFITVLLPLYATEFCFIAASQSAVASLPFSASRALTMAWKSAPDGLAAHRPFQAGSARSRSDFGSWASGSSDGLYAKTVDRAAIPVQLPELGR